MDPFCLDHNLFPSVISQQRIGVKLLGGAVNIDTSFVMGLMHMFVAKSLHMMDSLAQLNDPQCELALLRACMGMSNLLLSFHTCSLVFLTEVVRLIDNSLSYHSSNMVVFGGPGFGVLQWHLFTLPQVLVGLASLVLLMLSILAFVASWSDN